MARWRWTPSRFQASWTGLPQQIERKVQAFLGFINFYHWFVKGFSHHPRPLFMPTKKNANSPQWGVGSHFPVQTSTWSWSWNIWVNQTANMYKKTKAPQEKTQVEEPALFIIHALERLTLVWKECGIFQDVRRVCREGTVEDEVAVAVQKLWELRGKSLVSAEWAKADGLLMFQGKVYMKGFVVNLDCNSAGKYLNQTMWETP